MTAHYVGNLAPPEPKAVMQAENLDRSLLHFILEFVTNNVVERKRMVFCNLFRFRKVHVFYAYEFMW